MESLTSPTTKLWLWTVPRLLCTSPKNGECRRRSRRRNGRRIASRSLRVRVGASSWQYASDYLANLAGSLASSDAFSILFTALAGIGVGATVINNRKGKRDSHGDGSCNWTLLASPTPFNRFVCLRCPSLATAAAQEEEEEGVDESRNSVKLCCSGIGIGIVDGMLPAKQEEVRMRRRVEEYQRVCIRAEDGGVVAVDWPASLDLQGEQGLDVVLLLVPGCVQGSHDESIRNFAWRALQHGLFPVVFNPRGCAGSPLTSPRLFTAADSEDVHLVASFIARSRPWSTLMAVGWGYGANMLTKYVGEASDSTPLVAAVSIGNPFDLKEASRSYVHESCTENKLLEGLKDILESNKSLFQGKKNKFDVQKAFSATSIREFDVAISTIVHGFDTVDEFYSRSSSRNDIEKIRIPMLFVQNDEIMTPAFVFPRNKIADNSFTSLLICCSSSSNKNANIQMTARQWCENVVIEWFLAVELALLKGRHPLLKDIDIAIKPSNDVFPKRWSLGTGIVGLIDVEENCMASGMSFSATSFQDVDKEASGVSVQENMKGNDGAERGQVLQALWEKQELDSSNKTASKDFKNNSAESKEFSMTEEHSEAERGKVLKTAQTIMRALDVTMPGILAEDQKKQVLNAVQQGETIITALQAAVPEEVCGKLTAVVSSAVQAQQINLKLVGLKRQFPSTILQKDVKSMNHEISLNDKMNPGTKIVEGSNDPVSSVNISGTQQYEERSNGSVSSSGMEDMAEQLTKNSSTDKMIDDYQSIPQRHLENNEVEGNRCETVSSTTLQDEQLNREKLCASKDMDNVQSRSTDYSVEANLKVSSELRKDFAQKNQDSTVGSISEDKMSDKKVTDSTEEVEKAHNGQHKRKGNTEHEATDSNDGASKMEGTDDNSNNVQISQTTQNVEVKTDGSILQAVSTDKPSSAIGVQQALDALTGFDDSTQMAVTNVFGVIEDMIDQFQKEKENNVCDKKPNDLDVQEQLSIPSKGGSSKPNTDFVRDKTISSTMEDGEGDHDQGFKNTSKKLQEFSKFGSDAHITKQYQQENKGINDNDYWDYLSFGKQRDIAFQCWESDIVSHGKDSDSVLGLTDIGAGVIKQDRRILCNQNANDIEAFLCPYANVFTLGSLDYGSSHDEDLNDLSLEYVPEENKWRLGEENVNDTEFVISNSQNELDVNELQKREVSGPDKPFPVIEPSYIISDILNDPGGHIKEDNFQPIKHNKNIKMLNKTKHLWNLVRNAILDALRLEVIRRMGLSVIKQFQNDLEKDMSMVANAVVFIIKQDMSRSGNASLLGTNSTVEPPISGQDKQRKIGTIHAELIADAISSVLKVTAVLRKCIPAGVVVGVSLAALRPIFFVLTVQRDLVGMESRIGKTGGQLTKVLGAEPSSLNADEFGAKSVNVSDHNKGMDEINHNGNINENEEHVSMMGAMTAALGATVAMTNNGIIKETTSRENECAARTFNLQAHARDSMRQANGDDDATVENKNLPSIVSTIAEKAMSVAAPVVPMSKDGAVDTERLLAVLTELSQRGGFLRLIGKAALLWGGLRGAMSLTDRLILFFDIAKRPLLQRLFGFACMLMLVWSPVIVPLLPTIVQNWSSGTSLGVAGFAARVGLYGALIILVTIWGKRIRGYEQPLKHYGLSFSSLSKVLYFCAGMAMGFSIVISFYTTQLCFGCVSISVKPEYVWTPPMGFLSMVTRSWKLLSLIIYSLGYNLVVSTIQELVFRSWLHEEVVGDIGFHRAVMLSGLAFSAMHWNSCLPSKLGFWLLSLALSGARVKCEGDLALPIGLHAALLAGNSIIESVSVMNYNSRIPHWMTSSFTRRPLPVVLGVTSVAFLALFLYPWNKYPHENFKKSPISDQCLEGNALPQ